MKFEESSVNKGLASSKPPEQWLGGPFCPLTTLHVNCRNAVSVVLPWETAALGVVLETLETVRFCRSQREQSSNACTLISPFMSEFTGYTDSDSFTYLVHMINDRMTLSDPV
ncbi:hypothetical protein AMECASPLE_037611 [Ameca splendens]|uniref:Uncharacterized protein n=1 Tax=Ameca splendens TaxID=208324 RepID=A0ABV0XWY8_9TELE